MEQSAWQEIEQLYQKFQQLGISEAVDMIVLLVFSYHPLRLSKLFNCVIKRKVLLLFSPNRERLPIFGESHIFEIKQTAIGFE